MRQIGTDPVMIVDESGIPVAIPSSTKSVFFEDFIGAYVSGAFVGCNDVAGTDFNGIWTYDATGLSSSPGITPATVLSLPDGVIQMTLNNVNQAENGMIYFNDSLVFQLNKSLIFECRVNINVLPTRSGTETTSMVFGMCSAHNATPSSIAVNAWFRLEAGSTPGLVKWETDDGNVSVDSDNNSTGVTLTANTFHIYQIDFTNLAAVKFYIDNVLVGTGNMAALANPSVQPYFRVTKSVSSSNTGIGTMYIDYVQVSQTRT
jgi:hypothetical protein